jgi:tRNA (cytidine/uridine-2'-O-)-methyltransferase
MFQVILYQPEIPPNTGNVIRLCANIGAPLHLIRPLGFAMDEKRLRRAGLDYHELAQVTEHDSLEACLQQLGAPRLLAVSTRGRQRYDSVHFGHNDAVLFGPETRGLPRDLLDSLPTEQVLRIPMQAGNRSLNLSNAVAVVAYEGWRQLGFATSGEQWE